MLLKTSTSGMANTEMIIKDLGELYSRIFDHHPVIKGEINIFVNEFEGKRKNRECVRLQRSLEYLREIEEKQIPEAKQAAEQHLPGMVKSAKEALKKCEEVLSKEENIPATQTKWLEEERVKRLKEWTEYMDEMVERNEQLDKDKQENVQRVRDNYTELEQKLNIKT